MKLNRLVMKFGGTSVGNGERVKNVADIVKANRVKETCVVVSAMSGITDGLVNFANNVARGCGEEDIKNFIGELRERHVAAVYEAVSREHHEPILISIEKMCAELEKVLIGVSYIGELTPRSLDYIMSFGERLNAPIVAGALNSLGVNSVSFTGHEAGIVTDSSFGKAAPLWEAANKKIKKVLEPQMKKCVPVITGFIAGDKEGRITTLSRGGSDYTAAIIGAALKADEIWIWTDVDGVMSTDPKIVREAKTIPVMSYVEATELAYFGAKVLHPKTIEPAMERGIPVRVRNTFNPQNPGTLIVKEQEKTAERVKAISVMRKVALLTVSGTGMIGVPGVAARVFGALAQDRVNILMISQGSSEVNISIIVDRNDLGKAIQALKREFEGKNIIRDFTYGGEVSIIAVVGAGMQGTRGIAARVFGAVADAGVNVLVIAQGSSEVNISFVVLEEDAEKAVKSLHREFIG